MKTIRDLTYEQLREVFRLSKDRQIDFKSVVNSIYEDNLSYEEFCDWNCFEYNGLWYSGNDWCVDINGNLQDYEDCVYVDREDGYVLLDDVVYCYTSRRNQEYILRDDENVVYYGDDYYHVDCLSDHNLVVMTSGEVEDMDNLYYWDSDGEWHYEPEEDDVEYVRSYHNGGYKSISFPNTTSKYKIGFEIEKEDIDVKESIEIDDFESATDYKWRKERDGSLDDNSGYELISPTFDFDINKIFEHINSNQILIDHINADISSSCGGHINLSENGLTGHELFKKIKGYTPLLYSLYYGRVDKNYSKGKSNNNLVSDNDKYQAIKIHSDRVEFRIISAVPSVSVLNWRCRLIELMLKYPCDDVRDAYYYFDTKFSKIIREVYSTEDKYNTLKCRLKKYTLEFENIQLKEKEDAPSKRKREAAKLLKQYIKNSTPVKSGFDLSSGDKVIVLKTKASMIEWGSTIAIPANFSIGDIVKVTGSDSNVLQINNDGWYPISMFGEVPSEVQQ